MPPRARYWEKVSQGNIELVRLSLGNFNRGDVDGLLGDADPEIEWHDRPDLPGATVHYGAQATAEHLRSALRDSPGYRVDADELVDAGDTVVVCGHVSAHGPAGEVLAERPFFAVYAIQARRIRSVRIFGTRAEALQAAGGLGIGARLRRWFSALSKGAKLLVGAVVAAGAVASAIGAILALWPPTPEILADLTHVSVDPPSTIGEWESRYEAAETASAPSGATVSRLATHVLIQTDGETTPGATTTAPTTTGTTTTAPTTTGTTTTTGEVDEDIVEQPPLSDEQREKLNGGLQLALEDPDAAQTDVGGACEADLSQPACGLSSTVSYLLARHSDVTQLTVKEQILKLFHDLRTRPPAPEEGQPLGVVVNFNVSLTGFSGSTVDIRWSLFGPGSGNTPGDWATGQTVLEVAAEAEKDTASDEFWVPLPRETGPYSLRIGVYDEDGDRLDYEDEPDVEG